MPTQPSNEDSPYREPKTPEADVTDDGATHMDAGRSAVPRAAIFLVLIGMIGWAYANYSDALSIESLAEKQAELRDLQESDPVEVFGTAFAIYVAVTGLSLPGAAALSLAFAWLLGFWPAMLLISFASTTGATVAFVLSRYLFRDAIQTKFKERLASVNESLRREGAFYLFTLRLIPAVPFFIINLVMGLTPMRVSTYWWVSQLGMLPGTAVYVFAGSQVPDLNTLVETGASGILTLPVIVAFVLLGLFPLIARKTLAIFQSENTAE